MGSAQWLALLAAAAAVPASLAARASYLGRPLEPDSPYKLPLYPIGANVEYMDHLAKSGAIRRGFRAADPWNTTAIKGVAYIPSNAINQLVMWRDYDAVLVRKELAFAAAATANTVRVSLHWALWFVDAAGFLANLDDFVAAAAAARLGVVLTVFDGLGGDPGGGAPDLITSGEYKTADWVSNPGFSQLGNASAAPALDAYVAALTGRYGRDPRVVGWDAFFQPQLCAPCPTTPFLARALGALAAAVDPAFAWVTTSIIPGAAACDSQNVPAAGRSLVAFENYNGNAGAVGGDTMGVQGCAASLRPASPLPVLLTGAMGRFEQPPSALCEVLFEAGGQAYAPLNVPAHPPIGVIIPWLMLGVDEFTRGAGQGLVWPNGSWYAAEERACFAAPVPPVPPPPPPPPAPGVSFRTADGLAVGLRNSTRAVQVLALVDDARWFGNFSFVPPLWGFIPEKPHRDGPGNHHVGDIVLRVQPAAETNASSWAFYSSAWGADATPAEPLPNPDPARVYDVSNLTAACSAPGQQDARFPLGLQVTRSVEAAPGGLPGFAIRWTLTVPASAAGGVRVGGLGFPLISDTFFGGTNNTAIAASGSFLDAHVGGGAGFATFTRADGSRTLLVAPCGGGDAGGAAAGLEAWRPVLEDASPPNEGMWEWTVHSSAWADEWARNAQAPALAFPDDPLHAAAWPHPRSPWPAWHLAETVRTAAPPQPYNPPSLLELAPGQSAQYALCFSLPPVAADPAGLGGPRARDAGLAAAGRPVLVGVPGSVLTSEMTGAALYVLPPPGAALAGAAADDSAVLVVGAPAPVPGSGGYVRVPLAGAAGAHGRARLALDFSDGSTGSAHFFVLPPLMQHSANYGAFAAATAWLPRSTRDSFGRSASFMPWDREDGVHVLQDGRPFVVGLSDDAGAAANLGMAAKLAAGPHAGQLALLDEYVEATLLGTKPDTAEAPLFSLQDPESYRVYMTLWYYDKVPDNATGYYEETDKCQIGPSWCAFNSPWCNPKWCALPPGTAGWAPATYRQYNMPHQTAVHLALYLAARNFAGLNTTRPWSFYLTAAVRTLYAANCLNAQTGGFDCLVTVGLMDGTVWRELLRALDAEGAAFAADAATVRSLMRNRTALWNVMDNPAGSEFAWDTTGQEEVAVWGAFFNASDAGWMHGELNQRTVDSILGYMTSLPTWPHDGAAYGMGDFSNNAKWMVTGGWEREGGHYRSGLNSIPVIERFRAQPDDLWLLRVGIAGILAPMPNIDAAGAPSMAFHTHPFIMEHDPNSGDHGLGWFGSSLNAGAYLAQHPALGLLCFLCDVTPPGAALPGPVTVTPRDTYRVRAYLAPVGLWLVAEAGWLRNVTLDVGARTVAVSLESSAFAAAAAGTAGAPYAALRLRFEQAAPASRPYAFALASPAGARLVRGAWEFAPAADPAAATVAVLSF